MGKAVIMKECLGYVTARRGMLHSGGYIDVGDGLNDISGITNDDIHSAVVHFLFQIIRDDR